MSEADAKPIEPSAPKRRVSPGLVILVAALLGLLWQREELTFRFNLSALERSEVPDQTWMRELGTPDDRALRMVERLWDSGKLPHRRAVIDYLRGQGTARPRLMREFAPRLLEAANDPDHSLRELVISGLKAARISDWQGMAQAQLGDADPAIRVYALNFLRADRVTNALPQVAGLINDPDVGVQFAAAVTIEAFAGEDFGLESWMGREVGSRKNERDASLGKASAWWQANQFSSAEPAPKPVVPRRLPELKFSARDLSAVTSLAWRGQPTLVQFFATYCTSCDQVLPEVQEVSQRLRDHKVHVVGVSLDAIPDDHNHFFDLVEVEGHEGHDHHGHGHDHHDHEVDTKAIVKASAELLVARRLGFRVVYDVSGEATATTDGGEIPVGIFLDAQGNLVRRFVGPRSATALMAMLRSDFPDAFALKRE